MGEAEAGWGGGESVVAVFGAADGADVELSWAVVDGTGVAEGVEGSEIDDPAFSPELHAGAVGVSHDQNLCIRGMVIQPAGGDVGTAQPVVEDDKRRGGGPERVGDAFPFSERAIEAAGTRMEGRGPLPRQFEAGVEVGGAVFIGEFALDLIEAAAHPGDPRAPWRAIAETGVTVGEENTAVVQGAMGGEFGFRIVVASEQAERDAIFVGQGGHFVEKPPRHRGEARGAGFEGVAEQPDFFCPLPKWAHLFGAGEGRGRVPEVEVGEDAQRCSGHEGKRWGRGRAVPRRFRHRLNPGAPVPIFRLLSTHHQPHPFVSS